MRTPGHGCTSAESKAATDNKHKHGLWQVIQKLADTGTRVHATCICSEVQNSERACQACLLVSILHAGTQVTTISCLQCWTTHDSLTPTAACTAANGDSPELSKHHQVLNLPCME